MKPVAIPVIGKYGSALTLMRIPFSVYLMPVYWFALSVIDGYTWWRAAAVFLILHVLVYPASNGYNSYHDRDEGSIGGLRQPPKVTQELFHLVLLFDVLAVLLSFLLSPLFALMVALYLLVSKAYSDRDIRLKKYPVISTLVVTIFQGAFTFLMVQVGSDLEFHQVLQAPNIWFALVSTLFLCGSYPLTQIYQHQEDSARGDKTLSLLLGIRGTFVFAGIALSLGAALLIGLYLALGQLLYILVFLLFTAPITYFFLNWVRRSWKNPEEVNFENTMRMNKISSLCISLAFFLILLLRTVYTS
ncbi:UbiA family prenyltransferase [Pontibacter sp. HSC-36F09]|uniref:UbiA family prenyltransferase n=1 Tax=Pontibacter sp. HSC-36F09 TaxID=2910966 RepID=UPI00209D8791|nr:UbiA family prenyltransferase [Pontibacter sp. HSC-36F09]MCP2042290.1 1,4-dihydroxy-2-naphthoate octaprenyltransferase [Pontibacter sp. HSC-36F09]